MIQSLLKKSISLVPWRWRGAIRKLPLVAPLQRHLLGRFLDGRDFIHTVDAGPARGLRFHIQMPQDKAVWLGNYEHDFTVALAEAVRPGMVCCDIGGYRGFMTGVLALAGAGKVHVFEPMPGNLEKLRQLTELNPHLPITVQARALGAADGGARFLLMPEASMGKLDTSHFQPEVASEREIEVVVSRLDSLVAEGAVELPSLLKIDVEGAEAQVLAGAESTLREHRPRVFIEAHSRDLARECGEFLLRLGYQVRVMETGGGPADASIPEISHLDCRPSE